MALRKIVTLPEPVLRRKAHAVTSFDADLQTLVDDMIETMRAAPGVGLAAPQVGVSRQLIVVEYAEEDDVDETAEQAKKKLYVMANPQVVRTSTEMVDGVEGCLSVPNLVGEVERHTTIHLKGLNRHGQAMKLKAEGWLARIFQHEIDHLNGVIFTDKASRVWLPTPDEAEDRV